MKRRLFLSSLLTGTALVCATWTTHGQAPGAAVPDQYIVQVQAGANAAAVAARHGIAPRFVYSAAVNGFSGFIPPGLVRRVQADPQVVSIVPNRVVAAIAQPEGANGKPSGGGSTSGQVVPLGVQRISAAPSSNLGVTGAGVGVAIVDTGIDFGHTDLPVSAAASFSAFGGSAQDDNGHGTHVAGTVGAKNNTQDVVGVAPGATLYAVKVLDGAGSGTDDTVLAGLNWVAANAGAIRVVNMSLGRPGTLDDNPALRAAAQNLASLNVTVVVAAGNDRTKEVKDMVPAGYPEVIAVASTTAKQGTTSKTFGYIPADAASYFTTDGALDIAGVGVSISAPGEDQENVNNGGLISSVGILSTKLGGGTTRMSGTSMASPHVAGVVALLCEQNPALTPVDAKLKVMQGALVDTAPYDSKTSKGYVVSGYTFDGDREGILNAPNALAP